MTKSNFIKMSGAGNDFVIIDLRESDSHFSDSQIAKISNRKNIGCDQLVTINLSKEADVYIEIYNADGSKSGACGNATRCVASLIMAEKKSDLITIQTDNGVLECKKRGKLISVNMGEPQFDWQDIPLSKKVDTDSFIIKDSYLKDYELSAVGMGNPHIVTFVNQKIEDREFFGIAPMIENNPLFPEKTNIEFVRFIALDHVEVRVWERGVGETLACGSGACAVGVTAIKKGLVSKSRKLKVSFKGGDLFVEWRKDNSVIMTGGYKKIFTGRIAKDFLESK